MAKAKRRLATDRGLGQADSVVLAYLCGNEVTYSWHHSMLRLIDADAQMHGRLRPGGGGGFISVRYGTGGLVGGRNQAAYEFLSEFPDAQWLFWLDTDMGFEPNVLELLLEAADPVERPIVGGLCFSLREIDPDGAGGWRVQPTPTIYDWITVPTDGGETSGWAVRWDYPANTVTKCPGTGSACVLIHRSALERIQEKFGTWYDRVPNPSTTQYMGEDLSFCARANALNIPIYVDTRAKTTHSKRAWIGEEDYIQHRVVLAMVDKPNGSPLPVHIDVEASLATLERHEHVKQDGMLKLDADLDRYERIIEATRPEVIVETGTRTGASAQWFADRGLQVITVDVNEVLVPPAYCESVTQLVGDAKDPDIAAKVAELVAGRRCMVSLDSDHSGPHVAEEIQLYGPLVTPGCYLVVEDGIFGYATKTLKAAHGLAGMVGSPLDAIGEHLVGADGWSRDVAVERLHPVTHHPAGFWLRVS